MLGAFWKSWRRSASPGAPDAPVRAGSIAFLANVQAPLRISPDEAFEPDLASMRLRVAIPAARLAERNAVWLVPVDAIASDPELAAFGNPRAIVVAKLPVGFFTHAPQRARALAGWVEQAAARRRVIVDFSDDLKAAAALTGEAVLVEFQERCLRACHATVPTQALREQLLPDARHGVTIVEDPFESSEAVARLEPGPVLHLAWFGVFVPEQRAFIERAFAGVASRLAPRPVELAFVAQASQSAAVGDMAAGLARGAPHFSVKHVPWTLSAARSALERADIVVLPQDAHSAWGRVKSHNRLVETLRAGRFAVASPISSYLELASYAWVGDDLASGVAWALANPEAARDRIALGQAYVAQRFAPARIASQWAQVLGIEA